MSLSSLALAQLPRFKKNRPLVHKLLGWGGGGAMQTRCHKDPINKENSRMKFKLHLRENSVRKLVLVWNLSNQLLSKTLLRANRSLRKCGSAHIFQNDSNTSELHSEETKSRLNSENICYHLFQLGYENYRI